MIVEADTSTTAGEFVVALPPAAPELPRAEGAATNVPLNNQSAVASPDTLAPAVRVPVASGDSLAEGMLLLLGLTIIQRLVGFLRGILFCRWLSPEELGQWDLAWGFFMLAAPLAVLGLPGSFGRYVERYRQAGQLRSFLGQTTVASVALVLLAVFVLCAAPEWFAQGVFNSTEQTGLLLLAAIGLPAVIGFNYLVELFTAMRQVRVVSVMQFANGILFAAIALALVAATGWGAAAVALGYVLACLATALVAGGWLAIQWRELPDDAAELPTSDLAATLLPFAAWVWVTNVVSNLVEVADRWMIVHMGLWPAEAAEAMLGQYHSSRVVPVLLVQLAGMVGGILLPYLSVDWEADRRERVSERVNLAIKLMALFLTACGTAILLFGPFLFGTVLGGKYATGLEIMPWTLVACVWQGTGILAHYYLWCAERARLSCVALGVALAVNIGLNLLLAPIWGLAGVVLATALGHAVGLLAVSLLGGQLGLRMHASTWVVLLLPLALAGGAWVAVAGMAALGVWAMYWPGALTDDERELLAAAWDDCAARWNRLIGKT